ncbi:MAG: pectate lyase [Halapricum sp.]
MATLSAETLVDAVRTHVDRILDNGNAVGGPAPLLPDAFDPATGEAIEYDARDVGDGRRLSNLAVQQEFLRTLVALTRLTGEQRYERTAEEILTWSLDHLSDSTGLLYWGGHAAYDLDAGETVVGKNDHELKYEYPFYELLFEIDPDRGRRFVEAMWNAQIGDWSILDFDRHGSFDETMGTLWEHEYDPGDVFFWGDGLTFCNAGSDLYYAAAMLAHHTDERAPLEWVRRLAHRYVETRQEPGISGYQYSQHPSYCNGPAILGDRAQYQFAPYIHGDHLVYESTLFRPRPIVQRQQLALGATLEEGDQFAEWALEELRAWREGAYRPEQNDFEPILTDGFSLEGFVIRREGYFGPKGRIVEAIDADWEFFWTYARAYRVGADETCWRTARDIARGLGMGDLGVPRAGTGALQPDSVCDYAALYGLLELYRATGRESLAEAARGVGQNLLDARGEDEWLVRDGRVDLEDPVPLALLHLAAGLRDEEASLPRPVGYRRTPTGGID